MSGLICPVSTERIDKPTARIGATLTALLLIAYALTGALPILVVVAADYVIRVLTPYRAPLAVLAGLVARATGLAPQPMDKAPKIFAWRVGFVLAMASLLVLPASPSASIAVAAVLAVFNLLDGVGNLCVGCVIYTYVVLPHLGPDQAQAR